MLKIWLPIILIVTLCFICVPFIVLIYFHRNKELNLANIMFLEIDLVQLRIKKKPIVWNKFIQNSQIDNRISKIIDSGWVDLSKFFNVLGSEEENKWKNAIEYCVQNKTEIKINSLINIDKGIKSLWDVCFFYNSSNSLSVNVKWINKNNKIVKINSIDAKSLIGNNDFKLFVAFNFFSNNKENLQLFLQRFFLIVNYKKNINYFVFKNIIVFVFHSNNLKKIQKIKNKIEKQLNRKQNKQIINSFCDAITLVDAHDINNENDLVKILTRISFGISKSKSIFKPFYFSIKSIVFNEFEEYKEVINSINLIIKNKKVEINEVDVKSVKQSKKILTYFYPKTNLEISKNNWFPLVIESTNFHEKIRTIFLEKMLKSNNKSPYMIDINDFDIKNYFDKLLNNKENIYIINIVDYKNTLQLIDLLTILRKNEIKFGLRVDKISSNIFSIFENSKPNIIIFTRKLLNDFNKNDFNQNINNISLILMCERLKLIPIIEEIDREYKNSILNVGNVKKYYIWKKENKIN